MTARDLAPIVPDAMYPLRVFSRVAGWQDGALREARKAGLRVLYRHGRGFIFGADAIAYILENGKAEKDAAR
jgi:hypothetical protein